MLIRPATANDVPQVLPMVGKLAKLHESWDPQRYPYLADIEQRYDRWLRARAVDPRSVFLVAELPEARIVGFTVATVESNIPIYRISEFAFLHDLWIDEDYRHEGIARQLTMLLIERLKQVNVTQIRLETAVANEAARALFVSCGFRVSSIEMLLHLQ